MIKEIVYLIFGFSDKTEKPKASPRIKDGLWFAVPSLIASIITYSLGWYIFFIFSFLFLIGGIGMLFSAKN